MFCGGLCVIWLFCVVDDCLCCLNCFGGICGFCFVVVVSWFVIIDLALFVLWLVIELFVCWGVLLVMVDYCLRICLFNSVGTHSIVCFAFTCWFLFLYWFYVDFVDIWFRVVCFGLDWVWLAAVSCLIDFSFCFAFITFVVCILCCFEFVGFGVCVRVVGLYFGDVL